MADRACLHTSLVEKERKSLNRTKLISALLVVLFTATLANAQDWPITPNVGPGDTTMIYSGNSNLEINTNVDLTNTAGPLFERRNDSPVTFTTLGGTHGAASAVDGVKSTSKRKLSNSLPV